MEISELKEKLLEYVNFMDKVGELKSFKGFILKLLSESNEDIEAEVVYAIKQIDRDNKFC